jgi:hypothetical protein
VLLVVEDRVDKRRAHSGAGFPGEGRLRGHNRTAFACLQYRTLRKTLDVYGKVMRNHPFAASDDFFGGLDRSAIRCG